MRSDVRGAGQKTGEKFAHRAGLGRKGERLAKRYLKKLGYRHLVSNYGIKQGEVDLIMQEGETIVFVEVKTRQEEGPAAGEELVNYRKRRRISAAALHFINVHKLFENPCRFDVVVVLTGGKGKAEVRHHKSAFLLPR